RLGEQVVGLLVLVGLHEQFAPAQAQHGVVGVVVGGLLEAAIGALQITEGPEGLRLHENRLGCREQATVAAFRFAALPAPERGLAAQQAFVVEHAVERFTRLRRRSQHRTDAGGEQQPRRARRLWCGGCQRGSLPEAAAAPVPARACSASMRSLSSADCRTRVCRRSRYSALLYWLRRSCSSSICSSSSRRCFSSSSRSELPAACRACASRRARLKREAPAPRSWACSVARRPDSSNQV